MNTSTNNEEKNMEKYFFRASVRDFKKIPNDPIAYWMSDEWFEVFQYNDNLGKISFSSEGIKTGNNDRFLRLWFEVGFNFIGDVQTNSVSWVFHLKGGEFRRWYGNHEYVIFWRNNGELVKSQKNSGIQGLKTFERQAVIWSDITSGGFSARTKPINYLFDSCSPAAFLEDRELKQNNLLAYLNSKVVSYLVPVLNPTLHFKVGNFRSLPYKYIVNEKVENAVSLSKTDWNSYETSWDFTTLPLLQSNYRQATLEATYESLRAHWQETTLEMQRLEEENNRIFIEAYGLEDELTPDVPLEEITLTCNPHYRYPLGKAWDDKSEEERTTELETRLQQDTVKEFISYAVGCMFGRYSLNKEGLVLANQGETLEDYLAQVPNPSFMPDEDNVIPMLDGDWFTDDVVERFKEFLKTTFGEEHYETNLAFIEKALNVKNTLNYSIRDYFLREFYNDHVRTYKKRPIYWLFSSPKGSFNALVYMHRYRPDTVSVVLNGYLREYQTKLKSYKQNLEAISIGGGSQTEKTNALKEIERINKMLHELEEYERDVVYPLATEQVSIDLDDGVKQNYPKLGKALKKIPGL